MPRMGGRETVERLLMLDDALPVLISSGYTESQVREKLGDVRVAGFRSALNQLSKSTYPWYMLILVLAT